MAKLPFSLWTSLQAARTILRPSIIRYGVSDVWTRVVPGGVCAYHSQRFYSNEVEQLEDEEMVPERFYSKINVQVKGSDYTVLESYCRYVITAGKALDIDIGGRVALPTRIQKFTVLKSPHIYKKHRVQYEIRTHARLMQVKRITGTTADIFLEYIQRNLPEGVNMSVYQERLDLLPSLLINKQDTKDEVTKKTKRHK
ncbi:small ribosomal subunit protein uS10m-like [Halichondria panicea]|uniref:small ribosomal subunit protein uS10m-like n=1 Tax=Halichondria panicea TaxID=6063 RepID=UPI00312B754B